MKRHTCSGFTLIELMVVVVIIAALAGMVLPHVLPASTSAKRKIALGAMANIKMALKMYRLNNNTYPSDAQGLDVLLKPDSKYNNEPYLEDDPLDPWGNKYIYKFPASKGAYAFDITSPGPDGVAGNEDDVHMTDKE